MRSVTQQGVVIDSAWFTGMNAEDVSQSRGSGDAQTGWNCRRFRVATDRPIWLKPNAGLPQMVEGRAVYATSPEEFAGYVPELVKLGVNFVGGCCGSNPDFVAAIARRVRAP